MNKAINSVIFWFDAARWYSSPTSIFSWSVPFLFGLVDGGNLFYGILSLIGVVFAHLGVNLFDDVVDYYIEVRKNNSNGLTNQTLNLQKGKCKYIIDNKTDLKTTLIISLCFFFVAFMIGYFFVYKCGLAVLFIMLLAGILCILYPLLTYIALGELAVGIIYGPLLYLGTYYVMTKSFSLEMMILSISTGLLTVGLLHTHTFMDYNFDVKNNKKTLCYILKTSHNAVLAQGIMMMLAYLNIIIFSFLNIIPKTMLLTFFSLPTAVSLYRVLIFHVKDPEMPVKRTFWMGPMENWEQIVNNNLESFMLKFLLSRNVMMIFTLFVDAAIIIDKIVG